MGYRLKERLIQLSDEIKNIIERQTNVEVIPTDDYGWENYRYKSERFRLAHVERYFNDGLLVLHITVFPHQNDGMPIFGLDIVGSEKLNKMSAVFIDYSPVAFDYKFHDFVWKAEKKLPVWSDVFSTNFIAIKPDAEEQPKVLDAAMELFNRYMDMLNAGLYITHDLSQISNIIAMQNRYCEQQAKNERTFNVLKAKIGDGRARFFMDEILFPKIPLLNN